MDSPYTQNNAGNDGLRVRALTPSDAQAFWDLRFEMLKFEPFAFSADLERHQQVSVEDQARRMAAFPDGDFMVGGFLGDALVASAILRRAEGRKSQHKANVYSVYVTPAARGQGVARAVLLELIVRAKASDLLQLQIVVASSQSVARRLYESLGFVAWGFEPRALCVDGVLVDEVHMVLLLR